MITVLMIIRSDAYETPGGDTTQVLMTAKYLREAGVTVDVRLAGDWSHLERYDILHFFNIIRPDDILPFLKNWNKSVCISTIFVEYSSYEKNSRRGLMGYFFRILAPGQIEYVKAIARWVVRGQKIKSAYYLFKGHKKAMVTVANRADLLLPNSNSEASRLFRYLGRSFPYKKVVNAIDPSVFHKDVVSDTRCLDHIICVARIEGLKNQLNLIRAIKDTGLNLTIIGSPSPNHMEYYNLCKEEAQGATNIYFIGYTTQSELAGIYKAAKVHVLPSWFETTGLSSLEAGMMDCNVVVTRKGDTEEYFGDMVYYCEPDSPLSIREAILAAYKNPVNPLLKNFISENYTWQQAARQTLEGYREVLKRDS